MIHFAQNNDIIIGVDFGYGNDIAVKTTAKVHEDGRLEILKSESMPYDSSGHGDVSGYKLRSGLE